MNIPFKNALKALPVLAAVATSNINCGDGGMDASHQTDVTEVTNVTIVITNETKEAVWNKVYQGTSDVQHQENHPDHIGWVKLQTVVPTSYDALAARVSAGQEFKIIAKEAAGGGKSITEIPCTVPAVYDEYNEMGLLGTNQFFVCDSVQVSGTGFPKDSYFRGVQLAFNQGEVWDVPLPNQPDIAYDVDLTILAKEAYQDPDAGTEAGQN